MELIAIGKKKTYFNYFLVFGSFLALAMLALMSLAYAFTLASASIAWTLHLLDHTRPHLSGYHFHTPAFTSRTTFHLAAAFAIALNTSYFSVDG